MFYHCFLDKNICYPCWYLDWAFCGLWIYQRVISKQFVGASASGHLIRWPFYLILLTVHAFDILIVQQAYFYFKPTYKKNRIELIVFQSTLLFLFFGYKFQSSFKKLENDMFSTFFMTVNLLFCSNTLHMQWKRGKLGCKVK